MEDCNLARWSSVFLCCAASKAILALEGVVDHGLFLDMVDVCIIAGSNGVEVKERSK